MKLSSISLIAATFAAPTPRPFEHGVDIYSRANPHQCALRAALYAASRAKKIGEHGTAEFHENDAKQHQEHVRKNTHNPGHVAWSINKSRKTVAKVEHMEVARLNRYAAHLAKGMECPLVAQWHEELADRNVALAKGTPNPNFERRGA